VRTLRVLHAKVGPEAIQKLTATAGESSASAMCMMMPRQVKVVRMKNIVIAIRDFSDGVAEIKQVTRMS
jgi:hypothetical protein